MGKERRAFTQMGGGVELSGDPGVARKLQGALKVSRPGKGGVVRRLSHAFHTYPARMHPETARRLVLAFSAAGQTVLDPFCGSGTVVLEALAHHTHAVGRDLSPLAIRIAWVKTWRPGVATLRKMQEHAEAIRHETQKHVRGRERAPKRIPMGELFPPHVAQELAWLRATLREVPQTKVREALELCLSSVLVKVSRRASDTDVSRVDRNIRPGAASTLFAARAKELAEMLDKVARAAPKRVPRPDLDTDDARELSTLKASSVDLIITSPPYPNTYDYHDLQKVRMRWLGLAPGSFATDEVGARRLFKDKRAGVRRWQRDGERWVRACSRVLRKGGLSVIFLGDGMVGTTVIRADEELRVWARKAGMDVVAVASQARPRLEEQMRRAYKADDRAELLMALRAR